MLRRSRSSSRARSSGEMVGGGSGKGGRAVVAAVSDTTRRTSAKAVVTALVMQDDCISYTPMITHAIREPDISTSALCPITLCITPAHIGKRYLFTCSNVNLFCRKQCCKAGFIGDSGWNQKCDGSVADGEECV